MAGKLKLSKKHCGCMLLMEEIFKLRHKFGLPKAPETELINRAVQMIIKNTPVLASDLEFEKAYMAEQFVKQGRKARVR